MVLALQQSVCILTNAQGKGERNLLKKRSTFLEMFTWYSNITNSFDY